MNKKANLTRLDYLLAGLSGILMTASFPNISLSLVAWVALIPLLWSLRGKSMMDSFKLGCTGGFVFFYSFMYWMNTLIRFAPIVAIASILLCLFLGLFWGGFSVFFSWFRKRYPLTQWLWVPVIWVLMEYIRGIGILGFPWGWLGFSQTQFTSLIQMASLTGVLGISFLVAWSNGLLFQGMEEWKQNKSIPKSWWIPAFLFIGVLLFSVLWGNQRIKSPSTPNRSIQASIIQGNIPQDMKWNPEKELHNFQKYIRLTQSVASSHPQLIVWPETAISDFYPDREDFQNEILDFCQSQNCYLLTGTIDGNDTDYYNALILNEPEGMMNQRYYKMHLVPFGEYLPLGKSLPFLLRLNLVPSQFSKGTSQHLMVLAENDGKSFHFGNLICFESLMPGLAREIARQDGDFIVIVTNDSWFEKTSAPYQHRDIAQFRAVETGRPIIRAANTGYSCFIDSRGRILRGLDIYRDGTLTMNLPIEHYQTFYTRWGDWLPMLCGFIVLAGFIFIFIQRKEI